MDTTYIYGSTGNQYIDCRIKWSSTPTTDTNTSKVTASLQYKCNNTGFTTYGTGSFSVTIDGTKTTASKTLTITDADWVTAVSATKTVSHNSDGKKSITISATGSISGTTLTSTSCSGTATLDTITRASTISYVSNVTLGNICTVRWTPLSKSFRYKIKFAVGGWSLTTEAIHPNTTSLYTNASYGISIDAAHQFPNSKSADMTVTLYTYSDSACKTQVGTASTAKCKVYIPENEDTLPTVAMSLSPVNALDDAFNGLYIQNKSMLQASFEGSKAKYSASISSYSLSISGLGTDNTSPYQLGLLSTAGTVSVKGTAKDSRGLSASATQKITVISYSKPRVIPYTGEKSIVCQRCDSEGNLTTSGTCLRIKAGRKYSKVTADGVQKNSCVLRYRHKTENATSFSSWAEIYCRDTNNLIPYPYWRGTQTVNGLTFTNNADGTITINGTATAQTSYHLYNYTTKKMLLPVGTYTISDGDTSSDIYIAVAIWSGGTWIRNLASSNENPTFTITQDMIDSGYDVGFNFYISAGKTYNNVLIKPMLNEGPTALPCTPTDEADVILVGVVPSITTSYIVQLGVIDDIGESSVPLEFTIPTADVTVHLRKGGKGVGLGKYSENDNAVEIADDWELDAGGNVRVGKTLYPNHIASIDTYEYKDFNELIYKTGYYIGTSDPSATSCANYPVNETGMLAVISAMAQNAETLACYQTYRTHTGNVYMRSYYSTTGWTEWKKVAYT